MAIAGSGDQRKVDREELAGGGTKTTGAEMTRQCRSQRWRHVQTLHGRQYAGWAGGVLQVQGCGGGSKATTVEAGGGVDDARTGLGDADSDVDGTGLATEDESGAELAGSESRADVAPN